jgi:gliding motility-associated-like protein
LKTSLRALIIPSAKFFVFALLTFAATIAHGQCLTDFTKLVPDPSIDYSSDYGRSLAIHDQYLAVSIMNSDSLGRLTGLVYMYEQAGDGYKKIASFYPSDPFDAMQFGVSLVLSENYLLVAAAQGGRVYMYKKGPDGWESGSELMQFKADVFGFFGYTGYNQQVMAISEDEQTIAIGDESLLLTPQSEINYYLGQVYVYHKNLIDEWSPNITPAKIKAPSPGIADFGHLGVIIKGNRIITGSPYTGDGGNLFIYHDPSGTFSDFQLEATLKPKIESEAYFFTTSTTVATDEGIFVSGVKSINGESKFGIHFYEWPSSGSWSDTEPSCFLVPALTPEPITQWKVFLATNGTDVFASMRSDNLTGYLNVLRKGSSGWCNASIESVDITPPVSDQTISYYGSMIVCNQNSDLALSYIPLPGQPNAMIALKTLKFNGSSWTSNLLYRNVKTTSAHYFGSQVAGYEDHLFVAAPRDGTVKSGGGAFYYYQKMAGAWSKKSKILLPHPGKYDNYFASAFATNRDYLAVGASGYETTINSVYVEGRVFIYKQGAQGWASPELTQEISIPTPVGNGDYFFGDRLAMNKDWLIIPFRVSSPFRIWVAIYKFNNGQWDFYQSIEVGMGNFFMKSSTIAVAIDGETLLAGNVILERNANNMWESKYILSPSDPEPIQISPDFTHWITNGSNFGYTNAINGNTILIGAPSKDDGATWDVGAVYVYTKQPNQSWSSRTETSKILPRIKNERELFGWSMHAYGNTLLVGAPGADYNKDGVTARNKPGRAYVYQTHDYFWNEIYWLQDFTGDSFEKDYFGINVYMDESDFFIGASIEDLPTGQLSGTVYVTPSPPIIKLVAPVCSSENVIDLFGYPFGGTWTGPALVDANQGTFDPKVAGPGVHEFRYRTPSCTYEGVLKIEVVDPPKPLLTVATNFKVCKDKPVSITLKATSEANTFYSWYYTANSADPFIEAGNTTTQITATKRGQFKLKAFNKACAVYTSVILIEDEVVNLQLMPPIKTCASSAVGVSLSATPAGGVWSGTGVQDGKFFSTNLSAGTYSINYQYTSAISCVYSAPLGAQVVAVVTPTIIRGAGNLCETGEVSLAFSSIPAGNDVEWKMIAGGQENYFGKGENPVSISATGTYYGLFDNGLCKTISPPIKVEDKFTIDLSPKEALTTLCADQQFSFLASEIKDARYEWLFGESQGASLNVNSPKLDVKESGFYQLHISKGVCDYWSDLKEVRITKKDSLFVPNFFSPNGDFKNEVFHVSGTIDEAQLVIVNRYGQSLFEGNAAKGWDGDRATPGVYFWSVYYTGCGNRKAHLKGTVQLAR